MHKKRAKANKNKNTTGSPTGRPTSAPSVFDLMVMSPKSGKGSKETGSPTSAPAVSAFDWIGYEGLKYSYYSYDIISHAIYSSPLLSFYRLLVGALIHHLHHSSKD